MTSPDMRASQGEQELFREAYACMEPSDATVERILAMTTRKPQRSTSARPSRRLTVRAALATAAATALLASGAYAAVSTGFFESAFGPKGQEDVPSGEMVLEEKVNPETGETSVSYYPERTWVDVDLEVAERLLAPYVEGVGTSMEVCGYTFEVESCVVDENGLGVATAVLSNPDGLQLMDAGLGVVYLENAAPTSVSMGRGEVPYSFRMVKDAELSTGTEARLTIYFGSFDGKLGEEGVTWYMPDDTARDEWKLVREDELEAGVAADQLTPYVERVASLAHQPSTVVPATVLTCEGGGSVEISPLGLVAYAPVPNDQHDPEDLDFVPSNHLSASEVVVTYADGSEYVVNAAGVSNLGTEFALRDGTGEGVLFNRLVDVDAVESVAVTWGGWVDGSEYEQQFVYVR